MIKLLNESRDYPLYHATSVSALVDIINSNKIKAVSKYIINKNGDTVYGISLTRDLNFATEWTKSEIIIEFDSRLLNYNYKLIPRGITNPFIKSNNSKNGKFEEFLVVGTSNKDYIINSKKYISKILVKKEIDSKYDLVNKLREEGINAELI